MVPLNRSIRPVGARPRQFTAGPVVSSGCLAVLCLLSLGCANPFVQQKPLDLATNIDNQQPTPQCQVVIEGSMGKPTVKMVDLQQPKLVGDVIREAKTKRRFSKIEVEILRPLEGGRGVHRLPVTYDTREKRIAIEQNYQVLPGDRVVIRRVESAPLEGLFSSGFESKN